MKLKELLHGLDVLELHADEALDITGVQYDSRQVTPGALFVAISWAVTATAHMICFWRAAKKMPKEDGHPVRG